MENNKLFVAAYITNVKLMTTIYWDGVDIQFAPDRTVSGMN